MSIFGLDLNGILKDQLAVPFFDGNNICRYIPCKGLHSQNKGTDYATELHDYAHKYFIYIFQIKMFVLMIY